MADCGCGSLDCKTTVTVTSESVCVLLIVCISQRLVTDIRACVWTVWLFLCAVVLFSQVNVTTRTCQGKTSRDIIARVWTVDLEIESVRR